MSHSRRLVRYTPYGRLFQEDISELKLNGYDIHIVGKGPVHERNCVAIIGNMITDIRNGEKPTKFPTQPFRVQISQSGSLLATINNPAGLVRGLKSVMNANKENAPEVVTRLRAII